MERAAEQRIGRRGMVGVLRAAVVVLCVTVMVAGCSRRRNYSQSSPDDVIESAVQMVKDKRAGEFGNLIYADSPEMRSMLNRLGVLFGNMQTLAGAVEKRFPEEMAAMKAKAVDSADKQATSLLTQIGGGGGRGAPQIDEEQVQDLVNQLFADPYGWLERNAERLSTIMTADDTAAILLDGEPVIPGIGLPMRKDVDGKWYIVLPTNMPGVSRFWPRTKDQWRILSSVVTVLDKTVIDMTADVETGRTPTLNSLGLEARKKLVLPGAIAMAAYMKEIEVRAGIERRMGAFQKKMREWLEQRAGDGREVPRKVATALNQIAPAELEPLVRERKATNFGEMSVGAFEDLAGEWMQRAGLKIALDGELDPKAVEAEVERWEAARRAASAARQTPRR